jgi:hypothetical protein
MNFIVKNGQAQHEAFCTFPDPIRTPAVDGGLAMTFDGLLFFPGSPLKLQRIGEA